MGHSHMQHVNKNFVKFDIWFLKQVREDIRDIQRHAD